MISRLVQEVATYNSVKLREQCKVPVTAETSVEELWKKRVAACALSSLLLRESGAERKPAHCADALGRAVAFFNQIDGEEARKNLSANISRHLDHLSFLQFPHLPPSQQWEWLCKVLTSVLEEVPSPRIAPIIDLILNFPHPGAFRREGDSVHLKVLYVSDGRGDVGILEVTACPNGRGEVYGDPLTTADVAFDDRFRKSIENAARYWKDVFPVRMKTTDIRWRLLNQTGVPLMPDSYDGDSLGLALTLGGLAVLQKPSAHPDTATVITGAVDAHGKTYSVEGYWEKLGAVREHQEYLKTPLTVIAPRFDEQKTEYIANGLRVKWASTIEDAFAALLVGIENYIDWENLRQFVSAVIQPGSSRPTEVNDIFIPPTFSEDQSSSSVISFENLALTPLGTRVSIIGPSRSGKSTILRKIALSLLEDGRIPILLTLCELKRGEINHQTILPDLLARRMKWCLRKINQQVVGDLLLESLRKGRSCLLIDGISDLPKNEIDCLLKELVQFLREHPNAPIIVTTNSHQVAPIGFALFRITPFSSDQIKAYINKSLNEGDGRKLFSILKRRPSLQNSATNPGRLVEIVDHWRSHGALDSLPYFHPLPHSSSPSCDVHRPRISERKLPASGDYFVGRVSQLSSLRKAWEDQRTNIFVVVAWGGTGKSALINRWKAEMEQANYNGAQAVFEWTFYSQGIDRESSDADFLYKALRFFGDPDPTVGLDWEKGERLGKLVAQTRSLLFLDGLEPLQYSDRAKFGELKPTGTLALLLTLAANNQGLCVITTRYRITNLTHFKKTVSVLELQNFSDSDGARVLRGIIEKDTDFEIYKKASRAYQGHALSLNLLGTFIRDQFNGDIVECLKLFEGEDEPSLLEARIVNNQAERILSSYFRRLETVAEKSMMLLMGLFDRIVTNGELNHLLSQPAIPGLTDSLILLRGIKLNSTIASLRHAKLLAPRDDDFPDTIDAHPLVREFFAALLAKVNPKGHSIAHEHLSQYWFGSAKEKPMDMNEMLPLYTGISHACQAGRFKEALTVYTKRILREDNFSTRILGASGPDFAALYGFFTKPFNDITSKLPDTEDRILVFRQTGYCLRSQGRLVEAVDCLSEVFNLATSSEKWKEAAVAAGLISQICLTTGKLTEAVKFGNQAVHAADRGTDFVDALKQRTALAYMKNQMAATDTKFDFDRARAIFSRTDFSQQPLNEFLILFHFGDFLLAQNDTRGIIDLLAPYLEDAELEKRGPLGIGLLKLILGQAYFIDSQSSIYDTDQANRILNESHHSLLTANRDDCMPLILIARAKFLLHVGKFESALADLIESKRIVERGKMTLYKTDTLLVHSELHCKKYLEFGSEEHRTRARKLLDDATKLIKRTRYNRRLPERDALAKQISKTPSEYF